MNTDTGTGTGAAPKKPLLNRVVRTGLWLLLASAVLCALLLGAVLLWAAPFEGATLHIDGQRFIFSPPQGAEWLLALGGLLLGVLVLLVVMPLAVFMPLLFVVLAIGIALVSVLGVLGLLASPLLLIGWGLWRLTRSPAPPREPGAGPLNH